MTLTSLFGGGGNPLEPVPPMYNDRGEHVVYRSPHWKGGGGGGGHKKGPHAALSALTLLAFLFFLNILQSCLRDQLLNQAPITIMMTTTTTTTTTTANQRYKRGEIGGKIEGKDYVKIPQFPRIATQQDESACELTKRIEPMKKLALWLRPILCSQSALKGLLRNMISLTCNSTDDGNAKSDCPSEK